MVQNGEGRLAGFQSYRIGDVVLVRAIVRSPCNNAYGSRVALLSVVDRQDGTRSINIVAPVGEIARPDEIDRLTGL
jgi:hypothetical protein